MTPELPPIRISAKTLGSLALENFCPRCFYLKMKLKQKLPWQIFPGIFSSIDSYSKNITLSYFDKYEELPPWFDPYGEFIRPIPVPHHTRYFIIYERTNIRLTGVPDDIFLNSNDGYSIIDYKTARFSKYVEDNLLPMYRVQLNGYALIGFRNNFDPVSSLLLCYYEPKNNLLIENPEELDSVIIENGFYMPFEAHIEEVELDPEKIVEPLLGKVREIGDRKESPEGREDCGDCERLERLRGLL